MTTQNNARKRYQRAWARYSVTVAAAAIAVWQAVPDAAAAELYVLASRSTLVKSASPMGEVIVADPSIADVHAHGTGYLSVIGKKPGLTSIRIFDKNHKLLQSYDVQVGYDLVSIRRALKNFLPNEQIGVEMMGANVALTGQVTNSSVADKAVRIANEFMASMRGGDASAAPASAAGKMEVMNLLQVTSGQQVTLRVRVGEIQRTALKNLSVNFNGVTGSAVAGTFFGSGAAGL
ncbi:MAG: pilus assembly protein N-terminal domain-containing protein, partial [Alphaproteobacteria bacterium]|nr:pilus assembly protein N-terminal domain-containing protein [Alphaproteobacteria bacterium]